MTSNAEIQAWNGRVIDGMPHIEYLKDPVPGGSLSSSGARLLIPPNCPAKYAYHRTHPTAPKLAYDLGTAAHHVLFGIGPELVVVDAENWRKKDNQAIQKQAYEVGKTPILQYQMDAVEEMATVARAHPLAGRLIAEGTGIPEQSLSWIDRPSGVMCRARLDWLSTLTTTDGRMIIVDYKTTKSADPDKLIKAIREYGYHQQGPWYIDAVIGCGLAEDAIVLFVFQEIEPPFLITVMELHAITGLLVGRELNDFARKVYARCTELGVWPGYSGAQKLFKKGIDINYDDDILTASLPDWEMRRMENIIGADPIRGVAA